MISMSSNFLVVEMVGILTLRRDSSILWYMSIFMKYTIVKFFLARSITASIE